ncbi:MAG TPA: SWIM zinc finger family protein, partial [Enhygromyxa sp.]|nr:SWIM zinc finger family protein [Enhygromyxa sp.]
MEEYLQAVREGVTSAQWSRAVKAAREGKVHVLHARDKQIEFRVETLPGLAAHTVTLEPEAEDWDCDCDARTDACEHVAAAAIALNEARKRGETLPQPSRGPVAHVGYRLRSRGGPLRLRRVLVSEAGEVLMPASLASLERKPPAGTPPLTSDKADRAFEKRFGPAVKAKIPPKLMAEVLDFLSRCADVQLDDRPIEIGKPSPGLRLRVSETRLGEFVARIEQDPEISELFDNGAFRRGRTLHAVGDHGLAPERFEALRKGEIFGEREVGTLVGQLLPELRKQLPITIETPRLPGSVEVRPRIQLTTVREGDALAVLPTIVYGDPPIARADGDRLTLLGGEHKRGARELPVRNLRVEQLLRKRLTERFGLVPGQRKILGATEAIELGRALDEDQRDFELAGDAHQDFFEAAPLEPKLILGKGGEFELYFIPAGLDSPDQAEDVDEFGSLDDDMNPMDLRHARRRLRRADARAVVRAWAGGEEFAPLLGGGFGRIPAEFMTQHGHLVADLLAAREALAAEKD